MLVVYTNADQLSKVGVVNFNTIYSVFFKESSAWRQIDKIEEDYNNYIADKTNQLEQLREMKLEAENADDNAKALRLDNEIYQLQEHLKEYHQVMTSRIEKETNKLGQSTDFASDIIEALQFIAESEGFTIILDEKDPQLLWYSREVDITEKVLDRLRWKATRE